MPSHEHHRIAPTRSTEEGNSADAVNKGAGFMMPDLNGMEFAVREGGKSLSLSFSGRHLFLFFFCLFVPPLSLRNLSHGKSCIALIPTTRSNDIAREETTNKAEHKYARHKKVFLETRFEWIWIWSRGHSRHYQSMKYIVKTRLYTQRSSVEPNVGRLI